LPPFGRELLELRRKGLVPARPVVVGLDRWDWGKVQPRIVLPADLDPTDVDLSYLAALDVELVWSASVTSVARRDSTLRAIVRVSPSFLWCIDIDAPEHGFFVISRRDGLLMPEYAK
jgi:hypothetical protein